MIRILKKNVYFLLSYSQRAPEGLTNPPQKPPIIEQKALLFGAKRGFWLQFLVSPIFLEGYFFTEKGLFLAPFLGV